MRHFYLFATFFFSCHVFSQELLLSQYLPQSTRSALLIETIHGNETFSQNTNQFFPPASTAKLLTALSAKLELGDNFSFSTRLNTNQSDVVIHFSGDPELTYHDLLLLFKKYKETLGSKIKGNIWLDNSAFTGYQKAIGWPWDILGVCYSAPSTAITLDHNCVLGSIYTLNNGKTRVHTPEQFPIVVSSRVKVVSDEEQKHTLCELELTSDNENHYLLNGCITKKASPLPLKFAVQNPELYATRMVYKIINNLNMKLGGQIYIGTPKHKSEKLIAEHLSPRLPSLLNKMLKKSDNLIANNLTKAMGKRFFIQPGSFANGTEAIKQILLTKAGIDLSSAQLVDGSGLSRNNRLTAHQVASVLKYILKHNKQLQILDLLPVAGKSGTLKYRSSMRDQAIVGRIKAKSGSLYGSHNMAGYGLDSDGNPKTIFVQFITDYFPVQEGETSQKLHPLRNFETAFYKKIINTH
ncbi:serine-type D-Ala-D-Ala carboxypeptidase [Vibrio salinus]|uniref:serine-type D-Ala-D-Ala carboxypeptidase n=1 Tax=Vibrio salinus TaxID=2899784 RepID=UPI001E527B06|nr:serine-type D-Ala-D-Ala carboxypeptidase [Vibrio salinus]MCE0493337.1 serine-type D-Ala-D-Ala carboxypeptidase [Vibrio salinus]